MSRFIIEHTPPALRHAPRNWYTSPSNQSEPIHVFDTQAEAIAHARSLPQEYSATGIIPQPVSIGWIHATDKQPLSFLISRTRPIIDNRTR